ncbi:hypothetical protein BGZ54_003184, partial [Gamsiella multidivaricata]
MPGGFKSPRISDIPQSTGNNNNNYHATSSVLDNAPPAAAMRASNVTNPTGSTFEVAGPTVGGPPTRYDSHNIEAAKEHLAESWSNSAYTGAGTHGSTLTDTVKAGATAAAAGATNAGTNVIAAAKRLINRNEGDYDENTDYGHHHDGNQSILPISNQPRSEIPNRDLETSQYAAPDRNLSLRSQERLPEKIASRSALHDNDYDANKTALGSTPSDIRSRLGTGAALGTATTGLGAPILEIHRHQGQPGSAPTTTGPTTATVEVKRTLISSQPPSDLQNPIQTTTNTYPQEDKSASKLAGPTTGTATAGTGAPATHHETSTGHEQPDTEKKSMTERMKDVFGLSQPDVSPHPVAPQHHEVPHLPPQRQDVSSHQEVPQRHEHLPRHETPPRYEVPRDSTQNPALTSAETLKDQHEQPVSVRPPNEDYVQTSANMPSMVETQPHESNMAKVTTATVGAASMVAGAASRVAAATAGAAAAGASAVAARIEASTHHGQPGVEEKTLTDRVKEAIGLPYHGVPKDNTHNYALTSAQVLKQQQEYAAAHRPLDESSVPTRVSNSTAATTSAPPEVFLHKKKYEPEENVHHYQQHHQHILPEHDRHIGAKVAPAGAAATLASLGSREIPHEGFVTQTVPLAPAQAQKAPYQPVTVAEPVKDSSRAGDLKQHVFMPVDNSPATNARAEVPAPVFNTKYMGGNTSQSQSGGTSTANQPATNKDTAGTAAGVAAYLGNKNPTGSARPSERSDNSLQSENQPLSRQYDNTGGIAPSTARAAAAPGTAAAGDAYLRNKNNTSSVRPTERSDYSLRPENQPQSRQYDNIASTRPTERSEYNPRSENQPLSRQNDNTGGIAPSTARAAAAPGTAAGVDAYLGDKDKTASVRPTERSDYSLRPENQPQSRHHDNTGGIGPTTAAGLGAAGTAAGLGAAVDAHRHHGPADTSKYATNAPSTMNTTPATAGTTATGARDLAFTDPSSLRPLTGNRTLPITEDTQHRALPGETKRAMHDSSEYGPADPRDLHLADSKTQGHRGAAGAAATGAAAAGTAAAMSDRHSTQPTTSSTSTGDHWPVTEKIMDTLGMHGGPAESKTLAFTDPKALKPLTGVRTLPIVAEPQQRPLTEKIKEVMHLPTEYGPADPKDLRLTDPKTLRPFGERSAAPATAGATATGTSAPLIGSKGTHSVHPEDNTARANTLSATSSKPTTTYTTPTITTMNPASTTNAPSTTTHSAAKPLAAGATGVALGAEAAHHHHHHGARDNSPTGNYAARDNTVNAPLSTSARPMGDNNTTTNAPSATTHSAAKPLAAAGATGAALGADPLHHHHSARDNSPTGNYGARDNTANAPLSTSTRPVGDNNLTTNAPSTTVRDTARPIAGVGSTGAILGTDAPNY